MNRLPHHQGIDRFLSMLGLALYYSKSVMDHLVYIIDAITTKGFAGRLTDIHQLSFHPKHRSTLGHFFTKSPWDETIIQQWILRHLERITKQEEEPIFLSNDKKRSLRHERNKRSKGAASITRMRLISSSGAISSFGSWFTR